MQHGRGVCVRVCRVDDLWYGASYGTLLLVDLEDEFGAAEVGKLQLDVQLGLSVVVFADW